MRHNKMDRKIILSSLFSLAFLLCFAPLASAVGPTIISPTYDQVFNTPPGDITFSWTPVTGAVSYMVWFGNQDGTPIRNFEDVGNTLSFTEHDLFEGGYLFGVGAGDGVHYADYEWDYDWVKDPRASTVGQRSFYVLDSDLSMIKEIHREDQGGTPGLEIEWVGLEPQSVQIWLFYSGIPGNGWVTSTQTILPGNIRPGKKAWVPIGNSPPAANANYFLHLLPLGAGIQGQKSRLFVLPELDAGGGTGTCLTCSVKSSCTSGSEIDLLHMSALSNAMAEIEGSYPNHLCCTGPADLSNICSGGETVLRLSSTTNAHVERGDLSAYTNPVCIKSAEAEYNIQYGAICPDGYECIATISGDTNAHIADCDGTNDYATKVCVGCAEVACTESCNDCTVTARLANHVLDPRTGLKHADVMLTNNGAIAVSPQNPRIFFSDMPAPTVARIENADGTTASCGFPYIDLTGRILSPISPGGSVTVPDSVIYYMFDRTDLLNVPLFCADSCTALATFCGDHIVQTPNTAGFNEQCDLPAMGSCTMGCKPNCLCNDPPLASLTSDSPKEPYQIVTLDASASTDPDGDALTYQFDCTNDGVFESTVLTPTYPCTYPTIGTYTASVTLTDTYGATATATTIVVITCEDGVYLYNEITGSSDLYCCGVSDSVCPEDFKSGNTGTRVICTRMDVDCRIACEPYDWYTADVSHDPCDVTALDSNPPFTTCVRDGDNDDHYDQFCDASTKTIKQIPVFGMP